MKLAFFTLAILFLVKYASSEELPIEKDKPQKSNQRANHNSKEVSGIYDYDLEDYNVEESNGTKSNETTDKDNKSYEFIPEFMSGSFHFSFFLQSDKKRKKSVVLFVYFLYIKILILHENDS